MLKDNLNNELIKRRYIKYLKEAEGFSTSTIASIYNSILKYENFIKNCDFSYKFNPDTIIEFKTFLVKERSNSKGIGASTFHARLRNLKKFFTWLTTQPGYKTKIRADVIGYLRISLKEERIATQQIPKEFPTIEYIQQLANSIDCQNEVDLRDRAIISFTALTGIRDSALISLPLKSINIEQRQVYQNPDWHIKTKYSKYIQCMIFNFDAKLFEYFENWYYYLRRDKKFNENEPLFPRSKTNQDKDVNISFSPATEVDILYWQSTSPVRKVFKQRAMKAGLEYFHPHTFRHFLKAHILKFCAGDGEKLQAFSQNFGHENIATTIGSYGNYPQQKVNEILKKIDFSAKNSADDLKQKLLELANQC